jgi:hypothetical protein
MATLDTSDTDADVNLLHPLCSTVFDIVSTIADTKKMED